MDTKTITSGELMGLINKRCLKKIKANKHKMSPMKYEWEYLQFRALQEEAEAKEAFNDFIKYPDTKNLYAYLDEIADVINFYAYMAAKALGFETLRRL